MARIEGGPGRNTLKGTGFEDELYGFGGNDLLYGRAGNDRIDGGTGADVMVGWTGNDIYYIEHVGDRIAERAGHGTDTVITSIAMRLQPDQEIENLILVGDVRAVVGNDLANRITVNQETAVSNILNGGGGADFMAGGGGSDFYIVDNVGDFVEERSGPGVDLVFADVSYVLPNTTSSGDINYIEKLVLRGSDAIDGTGNDRGNLIKGNDNDNVLKGGGGVDTLIGGAGDDSLYGGITDGDVLLGGEGNDGFYFEQLEVDFGFLDYVNDFTSADDTVFLDRAAFTEIGAGTLGAEAFVIGTQAQDADDRIIYDPDTGRVMYDRDGSGEQEIVTFMVVPSGTAIEHTDFVGYG